MTSDIDWYLDFVKQELVKLKEAKFTGNVEFRPNFKDGNICNLNCSLHRSIKKTEDI